LASPFSTRYSRLVCAMVPPLAGWVFIVSEQRDGVNCWHLTEIGGEQSDLYDVEPAASFISHIGKFTKGSHEGCGCEFVRC
jgi:hypothetical protein